MQHDQNTTTAKTTALEQERVTVHLPASTELDVRYTEDGRAVLTLPRDQVGPIRAALNRAAPHAGEHMLTFDRRGVEALLDHTLQATDRSPTWGQIEDDVPPGLWLVGDHGIYLMSNGRNADGKHGKPVAYAMEADPDVVDFFPWNDLKSDIFAGDGNFFLPAVEIRAWIDDTPRAAGVVKLYASGSGVELISTPF